MVGNYKSKLRVGAVQYLQKGIGDWSEFEDTVKHHVHVAADYGCEFLLFPELFTLQLLSISKPMLAGPDAIARLSAYTPEIQALFTRLAREKKINLIVGSHPSKNAQNAIRNTAYIFMKDGMVSQQDKIHTTPSERNAWSIEGGTELSVFNSEYGPFGVLICYDSEFPELARVLVDKGARLIFVPFCTDDRNGYLRVRYCCHARAIENQCYVVLSGNVGNLRGVMNMDVQYGKSAILTPCDFPFARDGVIAELENGVDGVVIADLDLAAIDEARKNGTVKNLNDRRSDLYGVQWK